MNKVTNKIKYMKKEFQMTQDELQQMKDIISRKQLPVMKIGKVITGNERQEDANMFWKELGKKYGFVWDSAEGVPGKEVTHFLATSIS